MCTSKFSLSAALLMTVLTFPKPSDAGPQGESPPLANAVLLDADALGEIKRLYRELIDAENRHDIAAVRRLVWVSPSALFVAKTATPAEGNWAGFWGTEVVLQHFDDLYNAGPFRIDPDYDKEKVVALTRDVVQTYVPVSVTVAYAGQTPVRKPFLMILEWVRTPQGWRMATDIALPIPPVPLRHQRQNRERIARCIPSANFAKPATQRRSSLPRCSTKTSSCTARCSSKRSSAVRPWPSRWLRRPANPGAYMLERKLDERTTFLRWQGTIEGHEFESLELLTDGPDGKLRERTVAYRPFPALQIFREKQRAAVGDSVPADSWDYV
jgi:hypothetical protein